MIANNNRLDWFTSALDEIVELRGLKSLAFPTQIARDGGGNWSSYYQAIRDLAQTLQLKCPIPISIYQNPIGEGIINDSVKQISLLNCFNLMENVSLDQLRIIRNGTKVEVKARKPTLNMTRFEKEKAKINPYNIKFKKKNDDLKDEEKTNDDLDRLIPLDEEDDAVRFFPETKLNKDWSESLTDASLKQIHPSWLPLFQHADLRKLLTEVDAKLLSDLEAEGDQRRFLPEFNNIFNAFRLASWDELKVVVIGQDPYYANLNEAMGLSFSVPSGVKRPPSLLNIFKEISNCYLEYDAPEHGDLTAWAKQGVLLLNTSLTVKHKKKECHMKIWKEFTDRVIELICEQAEKPVIFMLWGNHAQKKEKLIDAKKHLILKATHPSPLGANKGGWFGCEHFLIANRKLEATGRDEIEWQT